MGIVFCAPYLIIEISSMRIGNFGRWMLFSDLSLLFVSWAGVDTNRTGKSGLVGDDGPWKARPMRVER